MAFTNYNLGDLYLKISSWFVSHKMFFRKWWVIVIIAINFFMLIYALISLLFFTFEANRYNKMIRQISTNFISYNLREVTKPQELEIELSKAIPSRFDNFDLVAKVKNSNSHWAVKEFTYKFVLSGEETKEFTGFLMPDQERYFVNLNFSPATKGLPDKVEFVPVNIEWQRMPDTSLISKMNFRVEDIKITTSRVENTDTASTLSANVINDSLYSFWRVDLPIVVFLEDSIFAVNTYTLRQFKSGDERNINVSWIKNLPSSSKVEILPQVNILETNNFMSS